MPGTIIVLIANTIFIFDSLYELSTSYSNFSLVDASLSSRRSSVRLDPLSQLSVKGWTKPMVQTGIVFSSIQCSFNPCISTLRSNDKDHDT
jgi:hypothetical protein